MDEPYVERMKGRLETMRKVAAMAHDPRIVEMVTEAADQLEEDINSLEAQTRASMRVEIDPPSQG